MNTLAKFIVRVVELIEAEARAAKGAVFRLAIALGLLAVALAMSLGAIALFAAALFVALVYIWGIPVAGALAIMGGILFVGGLATLTIAFVLRGNLRGKKHHDQ